MGWLGEVPEHWPSKRLRFVADLNPSKTEISSVDRSTEVSFLPMEAIGDDGSLDLGSVKPLGEVENGYTYFADGDVTLAKITPCFENGKGALMKGLAHGIGFGTTELVVARPRANVATGAYLHYLFLSPAFRDQGEARMYGAGGQKRVPDSFVRDFCIAWPPPDEQLAITSFLGRETSKIDALISEQQRLVELLTEKRQAVISHAVTKGLNPKAPMKTSGVEWLGDVPVHWEVKRLKQISPEITVGIVVEPSKYYVPDGVPALRSLNVQPGVVSLDNLVFISADANELHSKSKLRAGDLVAVRSGQPGTTAIVPASLDGCNCIDLIIIRRPHLGTEQFLCWYLASDAAVSQFSSGSGGAIQQHFNVGAATNMFVPDPPVHEQQAIVAFINAAIAKTDALITEAQKATFLLTERRAALISSAVAGQIDVRDSVSESFS